MTPPRDKKDPPLATMATATPLPPHPSAPPLDLDPPHVVASPTAVTLVGDVTTTTTTNAAAAAVVPPPFLIPNGRNLSKVVIPDSKEWKPSSKLAKRCAFVPADGYAKASETRQLRELSVPVSAAQTVAFLYCAAKGKGGSEDAMAKHVEGNALGDAKAKQTYRWALLTAGSIQFKKLPFGSLKTMFFNRDSGPENVNVSIFALRGVHVGPNNNDGDSRAVLMAFRHSSRHGADATMRYIVYQTPSAGRFLTPLAEALVAAYAARPLWSVPVSWTGDGDAPRLPPVTREDYSRWMGADGGFSAAVYAAALAFHVNNKVPLGDALRKGRGGVARRVAKQQPPKSDGRSRFLPDAGPVSIDLGKLAEGLGTAVMHGALTLAGLRALSFNLVFRRLKLSDWKGDGVDDRGLFRNTLGQALLYNVTLREVDFENSVLTDVGEVVGEAWAMNAQPLISRVNFSNCRLNAKDLGGLLRGLSRIWCGGTALAESLKLANNPDVPAAAWDEFFAVFVDPSARVDWPREPPPPPNLSFLQELDVAGTRAVGPGLLRFARGLNGLRSLKLSQSSGGGATDGVCVADVLLSLAKAGARLERFAGDDLDSSCNAALFAHCTSLKELTLNRFGGDASSLLCGWPEPVPTLSMTIGQGAFLKDSLWSSSSKVGYSPGNLTIFNVNNLGIKAMTALSSCTYENGLKKLTVHGMGYWQLSSPTLTRLESCVVYSECSSLAATTQKSMEIFWTSLAQSKTLCDLQVPDQLARNDCDELSMVGRFLKTNRSVRRIGFDSPFLLLNVESVKVLRSAFYGNKKVIDLEYPSKARSFTIKKLGEETKTLWREVAFCKQEIKKLFQRAYSKYNSRWRDTPNRQKLPWVDRIRVAKRRIGQIQRDQKKIAELLDEIQQCVHANKLAQQVQDAQKAKERIARREGQLEHTGEKKKKFAANLVTKLNKAKLRGRQQKSAKTQLPRSTYYKSPNIWPSSKPPRYQNGRPHSYYNYYNDPYYARPYWYYYNSNGMYGQDSSIHDGEDNEELRGDNAVLGGMLSDVDGVTCEQDDPWSNVDTLVQSLGSDYGAIVSPEYLALLHEECSELGPDVVENIRGTLDDGAAISNKLDEIGEKTNAPPEMLGNIVDRGGFDPAVMDNLVDIPDYDPGDVADADADTDGNIAVAGDVVDMYAGAGPRDLDDGGPSFGGSRHAVLAGARRRARARKTNRSMRRAREDINRRLQTGYQRVDLITRKSQRIEKPCKNNTWPGDLVRNWIEETQIQQIKAIADVNLFDLPAVSNQQPYLLNQFSPNNSYLSTDGIEVVLVTQCSLDRLQNLKAQLTRWAGKASVAIYLKPRECRADADLQIMSIINEARNDVEGTNGGNVWFDVAITLVEGCIDDEPYPINYLRNVALLEARRQHLRLNASLDKLAVLLVDVDFRPSTHLFKALHSQYAARRILGESQVVVCPAFESDIETCAKSLSELKKLVDEGQAEGFHLSHFSQGHSPTRFDQFWEKSLQCREGDVSEFWHQTYQVKYENSFEPYIVMASADVPLYDERFQGYGLNKVSHLATIASQKGGYFTVLPGVFLVAPAHKRSESWAKRYGTRSDETIFNQLSLKGLYYNFTKNLDNEGEPVVSATTASEHTLLLEQVKMQEETHNEYSSAPKCSGNDMKKIVFSY